MQTGPQVADQAIQGILQRIDALASKIGTTAAHVYDVYIAQSKVEAIRDLMVMAIMLVFIAAGAISFKLLWEKAEKESGDFYGFLCFVCAAVVVVGTLSAFIFGYSAVGEWLNPQYWAFQHLMQDLKSLF